MNNNIKNYSEQGEEVNINLFYILTRYKWLIFIMIILFFEISSIYLYFKPSIYSTNSIIEVKRQEKGSNAPNDLLQNAFYATSKQIDKEIEVLKTFEVNQKVIQEINFKTQVFMQNGYRKRELYGEKSPIEISSLKVYDSRLKNKMIKIIPLNNAYRLEIEHSLYDKFLNTFFDKQLLDFEVGEKYSYNSVIKTSFFELKIEKCSKFTQPIFFKMHGDSRNIYEKIVRANLKIQQLKKNTPLILISYEDTIPERATSYVNKLVEQFLKKGIDTKTERNTKILKFIDDQLHTTKSKLGESEKALEKYKRKNKLFEPSAQASMALTQLNSVEVELLEFKLKKKLVDESFNVINQGDIESVGSMLNMLGDKVLIDNINFLQKLEVDAEKLKSEYTDEFPKLQAINNQVNALKRIIRSNIKELSSSIKHKMQSLEKLKKEYEHDLKKLPSQEINLINLQKSYEVNSKMYDYLLEKKSENNMIKAVTVSDYRIVEKAYEPSHPIKPKKMVFLLFSLILGFIVGLILGVLHNIFHRGIYSKEDIEKFTEIPALGVLPSVQSNNKYEIEVFKNNQSAFTELYRRVRVNLNFYSPEKPVKVILLSSIEEKVGKSAVVANLSAIFQLAGSKVIVIDLNFRNPELFKYFDINYEEGISNYLGGRVNINDIIFSSEHLNLDIIPAGTLLKDSSELLLSHRLEVLIEKLREQYDYIFIDTAPIGKLTDTLPIMKYADVNLVVLKQKHSKKNHIKILEKIVKKYRLENVAIILNTNKYNRTKIEHYV